MVVEAWLVGADFTGGSPPHFISSVLIVPISFTGRFKKELIQNTLLKPLLLRTMLASCFLTTLLIRSGKKLLKRCYHENLWDKVCFYLNSSVGPVLGLLPNIHQFESPQSYQRFIRSLNHIHDCQRVCFYLPFLEKKNNYLKITKILCIYQ